MPAERTCSHVKVVRLAKVALVLPQYCLRSTYRNPRELTAEWCDGGIYRLDQDVLPVKLDTIVSTYNWAWVASKSSNAHLFTALSIQADPANFNCFRRVFCDIDAVLVAGSCNMDDNVTIKLGLLRLGGGHGGHLETPFIFLSIK